MEMDRVVMDLVTSKSLKKGIITEIPPRHGKSWYYGMYLPAWFLGTYPERRVGYLSYSDKQARKFGRRSRAVFKAVAPILWGLNVAENSKAANEWNIEGEDGGMETAGMQGGVSGNGFHLLIVDDPVKNDEEAVSEVYREKCWETFHTTVTSRLEPGGVIIVNMTRWHQDDLVGRLRQSETFADRWEIVSFPAIADDNDLLGRQRGEALWPMRYPLKTMNNEAGLKLIGLEDIRDDMPLNWWKALYQQTPTKHGSIEWPSEYFEGNDIWFDEWPTSLDLRCMALDPSKGKTRYSDYSAFILLGRTPDGTMWVEADLDRRPTEQMVQDGLRLVERFRPEALGIEGNAWQDLLAPQFKTITKETEDGISVTSDFPTDVVILNNQVDKLIRIRRLGPAFKNRRVRFRNTKGTKLLVSQLKEFPMAAHDDGPDAFEMATRVGHYLLTGDLSSGMERVAAA